MKSLHQVREALRADRGAWEAISDDSGVPLSTIEKIAYNVTQNPRFETVERLRLACERQRGLLSLPERVA